MNYYGETIVNTPEFKKPICMECEHSASIIQVESHAPKSICCNASVMTFEEFSQLQAERIRRKAELKKIRRRNYQRERYQAMRSLGLKRTPYGWE